jgi:HD-GYP domain-containing protein (c-di-GMP phosphodiesterase class II)
MKLKKIKAEDLQVGMFIVNMGRSWFQHPFLRNKLKITSLKQIQKFKKYGIAEVYIDPDKGLDAPYPSLDSTPQTQASEEPPSRKPAEQQSISSPLHGEKEPADLISSDASDLPPPGSADLFPPDASGPPPKAASVPLQNHEAPSEPLVKSDSVIFWENNASTVEQNLARRRAGAPAAERFKEKVPFVHEVKVALEVQKEAQTVIRNTMHDIRLGRSIQSDRVKRIVNSMIDSILNNSDALASLTRMKGYDEYTFVHSINVCILSLTLARHLSFSREEMLEIGIGALLHDVGLMKIPSQILKKPESLTEEEWNEVKKHPLYGYEIMESSKGIPNESKPIALHHHEREDGSGYPYGLKGEEISRFGQMAGIIDFYDAITSDRWHKKGLQPHEGIQKIYEKAQSEFNLMLVERFIQCIGIYPFGTLVLLDTEELGIVCRVNPEKLLRPNVLVIFQNSKTPYPQPFLADLAESIGDSQWIHTFP